MDVLLEALPQILGSDSKSQVGDVFPGTVFMRHLPAHGLHRSSQSTLPCLPNALRRHRYPSTAPGMALWAGLGSRAGECRDKLSANPQFPHRLQVIILGTGKKSLEAKVAQMEAQFPASAKGVVEFNGPLAHIITAGTPLRLYSIFNHGLIANVSHVACEFLDVAV